MTSSLGPTGPTGPSAPQSFPRPPLLDNPRAERVRKVAGLASRNVRQRSRLILVEGPQAVRELVAHRGDSIRDVYVAESAADAHSDIVGAARRVTRWVHPATDDVVRAMSGDAQGIVAVADAGAIEEPDEIALVNEFAVVLARIQDPGNAGTLIRTADAMGAACVILLKGSAEAGSPKVIRSSAGSVFHLPVLSGISIDEAATAIHSTGGLLMGTSGGEGSLALNALVEERGSGARLAGAHAWVLGNEAQGMDAHEMELCDHLVRIPMPGKAESLNVSQAGAMCMFASMTVGMRTQEGR